MRAPPILQNTTEGGSENLGHIPTYTYLDLSSLPLISSRVSIRFFLSFSKPIQTKQNSLECNTFWCYYMIYEIRKANEKTLAEGRTLVKNEKKIVSSTWRNNLENITQIVIQGHQQGPPAGRDDQ